MSYPNSQKQMFINMREKLYSLKGIVSRALLLVTMVALCCYSANAAGASADDPVVLEDGGSYTIGYSAWYAVYTVPEDVTVDNMVIEIVSPVRSLDIYSDADYSASVNPTVAGNFSPYTFTYTIPNGTAQGTKFYVMKPFDIQTANGTVTFKCGAPTPFALSEVIPAEGSQFSAAANYVSFTFNKPVKVTSAQLKVGSVTKALTANTTGNAVSVEPKSVLAALYADGTLKAGDTFSVELLGVQTSDGAESLGTVSVNYVAAAAPTTLVSSVNTPGNGRDTFLSYIMPDDETGVVTLQFSGDLTTSGVSATLNYGNVEYENESYIEALEVTYPTSSSIAIDLRGKLRTPEIMLPSSAKAAEYEKYDDLCRITLAIKGVKDTEGNYALSDIQGALGSYSFTYAYEKVNYALTYEFTPGANAEFTGNNIELWLRETGGKMSFDGVKFEYTSAGVAAETVVPMSEITVEADADDADARIFTIPTSAIDADGGTAVNITLDNVKTPDGLDHSSDVTVSYIATASATDAMKVLSAKLVNKTDDESQITGELLDILTAESIDKFPANSYLEIQTSIDDKIGCIVYQIDNLTNGTVVKSFYETTTKSLTSTGWSFWLPIDYKFFKDNQYAITLRGYETNSDFYNDKSSFVDSTAIVFNGALEEFQYSPVTLVQPSELKNLADDPDFVLESADQNTFDLVFSDAVTVKQAFAVLGMGMTENCTTAVSADGTTVTVTIPSSLLDRESFSISVQVADANGLIVKGNNGEEVNSFFTASIAAKFNLPYVTLVEPADGASVEKLSTLKFSFDDGLAPSWLAQIEVQDKLRNVVAKSADCQVVYVSETADYGTECIVTLNNEITESGYYSIILPEGYFNCGTSSGSGFTIHSNHEAIFSVIVSNSTDPVPSMNISVTPAPGTVASLNEFEFIFNDYETCNWTYSAYPTISNGVNTRNITNLGFATANNGLTASLGAELTEPGTYTVTIPVGAVTFNDDPDNVNTSEASFVYTIPDASSESITITPAEGTVTSLKTFNILFNNHSEVSWGNGYPTLTTPDGTVSNVTGVELGVAWNEVIVNLDEEITADGDYILTLPAGVINYEDGSSNTSDFAFHYTIGSGSGKDYTVVANPADGAEVTSLKSVILTFTGMDVVDWAYNFEDYDNEDTTPKAILTKPSGETVTMTSSNLSYNDINYNSLGLNQLCFIFDEEYTEAGTYTLNIEAGFFEDSDDGFATTHYPINQAYSFSWTVVGASSGIEAIFAEDGVVNVYKVNGIQILKDAEPAELRSLDPGLYIINGKKVYLRK